MTELPPCVVFEDEHLLVVNKPPGWNTHSPSPYAGEGIYEWFKHREPRWAKLAIIHRLDKETSGLLVFSKTPEANRALTQQFTEGIVRKEYLLRSANPPLESALRIESNLTRTGNRYRSCRGRGDESSVRAVTEFAVIENSAIRSLVLARPLTGRTHQIRVHASENGFPILGDSLYGGAPFHRTCLHSRTLRFRHPVGNKPLDFSIEPDFDLDSWRNLRESIITPTTTNSYRLIHGGSDGFPGWYVDRFGLNLLSQSPHAISAAQIESIRVLGNSLHHKITTSHIRGANPKDSSPHQIFGEQTTPFPIRENDVNFEINFEEGYSVGIFLDQRDNRRRLLRGHIAADFPLPLKGAEVLNTFAYTCAFSVCAALAGARVTSLDLSRKYLDWGRRNFALNNLDPSQHDFIYGDVFDWIKRLAKKGRTYDLVLLDPPTFSQSKQSGLFRAESDYGKLVSEALRILKPHGVLFCSTNAARLEPEKFLQTIRQSVASARRKVTREHYFPQPPDFPISKSEPAYLKTAWFQIA